MVFSGDWMVDSIQYLHLIDITSNQITKDKAITITASAATAANNNENGTKQNETRQNLAANERHIC